MHGSNSTIPRHTSGDAAGTLRTNSMRLQDYEV